MHGPQPLAAVLDGVLRRRGWRERYLRQLVLVRWAEWVGPELAAHARPVGWRGDALLVEVDHAVWAQELTFLRPTLVARLNERLGAPVVRDLRVRVGRPPSGVRRPAAGEAPGPDAAPPTPPAPLPPAWREALAQLADAELRQRLQRCAAAWCAAARRCPGCGAPVAGGPNGPPDLCAACRWERGPDGPRARLLRWLADHPWAGPQDAEGALPGASRWLDEVREELRRRWWERLQRLVAADPASPDAREHALRYVMLVTAQPRSRLTHELAYAALGPLAARIWPPDGPPDPARGADEGG